MHIDFDTALAASSLVYFILGLLLLLSWIRSRSSPWLAWAAAAFCTLGTSTAFNLFGTDAPETLRLAIATTLLVLGFALMWQAMRIFEGRKPFVGLVVWTVLISFCLFAIPDIGGDRVVRLVLSSLAMAGGLALAARETWRGRSENLPSKRAVTLLFVFHAAMFAVRGPFVTIAPFPFGIQPGNDVILATFYGGIIALSIAETILVISMTLERAEKAQRDLAVTDPMTGMLNRRGIEQAFEDGRLPAGSALVVFDLDRFKQINDSFGHAAGDKMIESFALICREELRQVDHAIRLGGEEFALVLARTNERAARGVAERIRERHAHTVVPIEGGALAGTASGGFYCAPADTPVWLNAAIASADTAMYRAKQAGRNRVCEARELSSASRSFDERCVEPDRLAASV